MSAKKPFYQELYFQVLAAIAIGVLLGWQAPDIAVTFKPLGDAFIKLIGMLIGPIIFCTIVTGIAGMKNMRELGKVGGKALVYFFVMSFVALVFGLLWGHVLQPGAGFNADVSQLDASRIAEYTKSAKSVNLTDFVMNIIPKTFSGAFAEGNILAILLVSILFGASLSVIGEKGRPVFALIDGVSKVFFHNVHLISKVAAVGAFGAIAFTIGKFGIGSVVQLAKLVIGFYVLLVLFTIIAYGALARYFGMNIFAYLNFIKDELFVILGTGSSSVVLPHLMEKLERLGCPHPVVGLVVPSGYSFNLNGTNLYMTLAIIFIAQALNIELSLTNQLILLVVAMLTSKGAAGVSGAAFVMLVSTLTVLPVVPVEGMVLILGIHALVGRGLAIVNLIGNGIAALFVAAWNKQLDTAQMRATLGGRGEARAAQNQP